MIYVYEAFSPESICYVTKHGAVIADDYSRAKFSFPSHVKGMEKIEGGISFKMIKYVLSVENDELQSEISENALHIFSQNKDKHASFAYIENVPKHISKYAKSLSKSKLTWIKEEAAKDLVEGLTTCVDSASESLYYPSLAYLAIRGRKIYGSDGKQLSIYTLDEEFQCDKKEVLLHSFATKKLQHLKKEGIAGYAVSGSEVHFLSNDGVIMSLRMGEAEYPDIETLLKLNEKGNEVTIQFSQGFMLTLERLMVVSPEAICVEIVKRKEKGKQVEMTMLATNKLNERVMEKLVVQGMAKDNFDLRIIKFKVSADILYKLLKNANSFTIEIGSNLLKLSGKKGDDKVEHYIAKEEAE